jgi:hypothetical protein
VCNGINRAQDGINAMWVHLFLALSKVGIGVCIRDDEGRFVHAKTEWFSPMVDVDLGEAMRLLTTMQWIIDLQLLNMDFEMDSKTVVDSVYGGSNGVSNYMAIINDCRHMLAIDLKNSDLKFIRDKQTVLLIA